VPSSAFLQISNIQTLKEPVSTAPASSCGVLSLACECWHLGMPVDGAVHLRKH
jgi:hypothetical protein